MFWVVAPHSALDVHLDNTCLMAVVNHQAHARMELCAQGQHRLTASPIRIAHKLTVAATLRRPKFALLALGIEIAQTTARAPNRPSRIKLLLNVQVS